MALATPAVNPGQVGQGSLSRKAATASVSGAQESVAVGADVNRTAESLFETRTVAEIRKVESNTRKDVEDKKQALRQLVGDSYRDLIASADTIIEMSSASRAVLQNISKMQGAFNSLSQSISAKEGYTGEPEKMGTREQLYAVGSRIKYLVDSPEEIWGCLDTLEYLEAAWRYLRSCEVHRLLTDPSGPYVSQGLLKRFPLLRHQWPTVSKFKGQIVERVKQRMEEEDHFSTSDAAVALAATASLEGLDSSQALSLFLAQRRSWVSKQLTQAPSEETPNEGPEKAESILGSVTAALQLCLCQVGELFLKSEFDGKQPLLAEMVHVDDNLVNAELIFEGTGDDSQSPEMSAWSHIVSGIRLRLVALPPQQIEAAATQWLVEVADTFKTNGLSLLRECETPAQLSQVEGRVRAAISSWSNPQNEGQPNTMRSSMGRLASHQASLLSDAFGRRSASEDTSAFSADSATSHTSNWQNVCDWVVGRQLELWDLIFEGPFMMRAKELIDKSFDAVSTVLDAPLDSCLQQARACQAEGPGQLASTSWPYHIPSQKLKRAPSGLQASGELSQPDLIWRQMIATLQQIFDSHLKSSLEGCLAVLSDTSLAQPGRLDAHQLRRSRASVRKRARVVELEPYIQARCAKGVGALAEALEMRLAALPHDDASHICVQDVEQVLILGRLAVALGDGSTYLRTILGSPDDWYTLHLGSPASTSLPRRDYLKRASPQLSSLQGQMSEIGLRAHSIWAQWAASSLKEQLQRSLEMDDMLNTPIPLCTWQETVLSQDGSLGGGDMDMKFSLPTTPTLATMTFLRDACRELQRAGGHMVSSSGLQLLEWELAGAVSQAMRAVLYPGAMKISEKGVLQLLLDVRYLRDVLSGGRPILAVALSRVHSASADGGRPGGAMGMVDPAISAALGERKREMVELESMLQDQLDPIDWATYEPYLWANEACFYQRCSVLFGCLSHLQVLHSEASGKLPANAETNIMNVTKSVPRFAYLPISQPLASDRNKQGLSRSTSNPTLPLPAGDMDETYSFADLGSRSLAAASMGTADDGQAFANLRSKITSRGQFLGSMFSDKAAEVANMATSSFGDFQSLTSTSSVFTSAFNSFTSTSKR